MPAFKDELEKAFEEGIVFKYLTLPVEASVVKDKILLTCVKMKLGSPDASGRRRPVVKSGSDFTQAFDAVITAIGEEADMDILPLEIRRKAKRHPAGHLLDGRIFRAGDCMNGPSTVIEALTSGREAADLMNLLLAVKKETETTKGRRFISPSFQTTKRVSESEAPEAERSGLDREDRRGISRAEAASEAGRCFNCGCVAVNPSDIGTALLALQGKIVTTKRTIEASDFFAPHATASTVLDEDEMIREILIPDVPAGSQQQYLKFTLRKPIDFAVAAVGSLITIENGVCTDARIALGAVAPAPFRAEAAETRLIGSVITEESATEAADAAVSAAVPLSGNLYKVQVTKTLVKKAIMGEGCNGPHGGI